MDSKKTHELSIRYIPERSSSKSPDKGDSSSLKRIRDLERERNHLNFEAMKQRKRLKLSSSFDTTYWIARRDLVETELKATRLTKQISIESIMGNTKAFVESEDGQNLIIQERSLELDSKLFQAQAEKMNSKEKGFILRRAFLGLFIGSETGLGIKNSRGLRDNSLQSNFRADLKFKMDSGDPVNPGTGRIWCPATGIYWDIVCTTAGHLFPWKCGEDTMEVIFGRSDSGHSELFKAANGILWSTKTEQRFEAGLFVIVPGIADHPTQQQVDTWEASDPREYKIRVLDPGHKLMKVLVADPGVTWADLDNRRLQFKTNFRPRAQYLYFAYCAAMLRRSFRGEYLDTTKAELRLKVWGVLGRYLPRSMLLGFVEEMGHGYKHLLEGAIDDDDAVVDATAIAAANTHIQETLKADDELDSDSDSDSDSDDEGNCWIV